MSDAQNDKAPRKPPDERPADARTITKVEACIADLRAASCSFRRSHDRRMEQLAFPVAEPTTSPRRWAGKPSLPQYSEYDHQEQRRDRASRGTPPFTQGVYATTEGPARQCDLRIPRIGIIDGAVVASLDSSKRTDALIHDVALPSLRFLVTRLLCQNQQLTWHRKSAGDMRRDKTRLLTRGCLNV